MYRQREASRLALWLVGDGQPAGFVRKELNGSFIRAALRCPASAVI